MFSLIQSQHDVQNLYRRISTEIVKQKSRTMAKFANSNAVNMFDQMISLVKTYDNQIQTFINSLIYCTHLALDIVIYTMLRQLTDSDRPPFDNETSTVALHLQNFASFSGLFFKKYHYVDQIGLMTVLLNLVKQGETTTLVILRETMAKMYGWN